MRMWNRAAPKKARTNNFQSDDSNLNDLMGVECFIEKPLIENSNIFLAV